MGDTGDTERERARLWAQVSGAGVLLEEKAFFKGRKTNQKKEARAFPAFWTCLLLGYLISAEEAGTEARFLLAVSKRNSGFASDLASPEHAER